TIGNCTAMDTVTVEVVPFSLRLLTPDTMFLCKPDTDAIRVVLMPADADIVWTSADTTYELQVTGSNQVATVFPPVSYDYNVTATFRGCTLSHDIHVRVDSLPDLNLIVIPEKDPYCAGDEVIIFAADADTLLYPDIEFMWMPMDGQIQDSTNTGNVYVVLQDTTRFIRNVENNACRDSSSVLLNVVPPDIPLSVTDTTLCPGDKFTVEVLDREIEDLEWDPPAGLSCTTCFEPEVTVGLSPMYTVTGEKDGCPVSGMLSVGTFSFLPINFVPSVVQACPGEQIPVSIDTTGLFNLDISVTGNNSVSCSGCPDPVITVGGSGILEVNAEERLDSFCGAFGQVQIVIPPPEEATGNAIVVCAGQDTPIDLSGMGFINPRLTIDNGSLSCNTCLDPVISGLTVPTILTVTDDNVSPGFCVRETRFPVILADTAEVLPFEISDPSPGQGEFIGITLVTMPQPPAGTVFNWVVNGVAHGENTQTVTIQLNEEENIVTVSWINSNGCLQTYTEIIPTNPPGVMIPNAFTPDDDEMNVNEMFRPRLEGNVSIDNMLVFNRWGQLVYEGNDPDGWDGTYNGEPAPPEVYGYLIRLQFPNGIRTYKGDVTLIR
ncbi:MAG: gliding motility-associated C-terminal domain-containing protein, partial [Saprospiraceae bacterium]|nr:gliding motility-associated C-terminal domain-containing protein [Saprospiraceae bacterium]